VTKRFDVQLNLLKSSPWILKNQHRIRLHIGTNEIFARVRLLDRNQLQPGDFAFVQLILEKAISANRGDRFVVRNYSPMKTIGGGIVLDNSPLQRHHRNDPKVLQHFQTLLDENPETIILEYLQNSRNARTSAEISRATSLQKQKIIQPLEKLVQERVIVCLDQGSKMVYFAASAWNMLEERIMKTLEHYHERHPYLPGMSRAELTSQVERRTDPTILDALIDDLMSKNKIARRNDLLAKYGFSSELTENQQHFYQQLQDYIQQFGFTAPTLKEVSQNFSDQKKLLDTVLSYGKSLGEIVVLANSLVYRQKMLIQMKEMIRDFIARHQKITVADFRDLIQASRKFAVALLEYFDEIGFTRREDDERVLNE
jgi:selenocysteine-specific elongation factor